MKKIKYLSIICLSLVILASCSTLVEIFDDVPTYTAMTYSTNLSNFQISRDDKVLVATVDYDKIARILIDNEMVDLLSSNGVVANAVTKTLPSVAFSTQEELANMIKKIVEYAGSGDYRYVLFVFMGEKQTYSTSDGIDKVNYEVSLYDSKAFSQEDSYPIELSGVAASEMNKYQSYSDCIEPVCKAIAKSIAEEYMKYVK